MKEWRQIDSIGKGWWEWPLGKEGGFSNLREIKRRLEIQADLQKGVWMDGKTWRESWRMIFYLFGLLVLAGPGDKSILKITFENSKLTFVWNNQIDIYGCANKNIVTALFQYWWNRCSGLGGLQHFCQISFFNFHFLKSMDCNYLCYLCWWGKMTLMIMVYGKPRLGESTLT